MTAVVQMRSAESPQSTARDELFQIVKDRSFRVGEFKLASGAWSNHYFNLKPTMMTPRGAYLAACAFLEVGHAENARFMGGLEMGAAPLLGAVAAISETQHRPMSTFFVRKQTKAHGTQEMIEGLPIGETLKGARVLVADDVATRGGSILQAVEEVRKQGGIVESALVLLDRQEGAQGFLRDHGVRLISVLQASAFL